MIERHELLALPFYERSPFTGSYGRMCYRVEKIMQKNGDSEDADTIKMFQATVWSGPNCYTKTNDDLKITHIAAFSEEGLCSLVDWMNRMHDDVYATE